MTRKKNCCENGFKWTDKGQLRRCMTCNPPLLHFAFTIGPAEGIDPDQLDDIQPDEYKAIAAEGIADYMGAAIEFLDAQEIRSI